MDRAKKVAKKRSKKAGLPPGSLVYVGDGTAGAARVTVLDYAETRCLEKAVDSLEECVPLKESESITWINIDGIQHVDVVERVGKIFDLHPLVMEDILNTEQRAKLEEHGNYLYVVIKVLDYDEGEQEARLSQLSLVLGRNFVLTFQDRPTDALNPLRERIRHSRGRIRKLGADYLLYALLDAVVDHYFVVLDKLAVRVERIEESVANNPRQSVVGEIFRLKRQMVILRKAVWPLREMIVELQHEETGLVHESTSAYLRDLLDHVLQIIEGIDSYREMLSDSLEVYMSIMSNRTNGVMKVLALFSAIFMPLTFITGIFGMNFKNFPELDWTYGFQGTVVLMVVLGVAMLVFFRLKRWL